MIFKNAFHLLVDNFLLNYKFLLYKLVVILITLALSAAILYPTLNTVLGGQPFADMQILLHDFVKALTSGNTEFLQGFGDQFQEKITALAMYIGEKTPNIVFFSVAVVLIALISRFLSGMGNFAFGCLLNDRMSSYAKTSFFAAYIGNLGRSALWYVVYVPLTFVYDLAVIAVCYVVFLLLLGIISVGVIASIAALMISVALLVAAQAVKLTLYNDAVPALVTDKLSLRAALKKSFSFTKERFANLFSTYLVTCLLILCINVLFAVSTFGAALLITVPMSYLMLICIQFAGYYSYGQRKYFLGKDKIVEPKEESADNFYDTFNL